MDLWGVLKIAFRRWYVALPVLALTGVGVLVVPKDVAPAYHAQANIVLQQPNVNYVTDRQTNVTRTVTRNPLLQSDSVLFPLSGTLALAATATTERSAVGAAGHDTAYSVSQGNRSAMLTIDDETTSPARSKATVQYVIKRITDNLNKNWQARYLADPTQRVTMLTVTEPQITAVVQASKTRSRIVIGAIGLAIALAAALVWEAATSTPGRRRPRRSAELPTDPPSPAPTTAPAPRAHRGDLELPNGSGPEPVGAPAGGHGDLRPPAPSDRG